MVGVHGWSPSSSGVWSPACIHYHAHALRVSWLKEATGKFSTDNIHVAKFRQNKCRVAQLNLATSRGPGCKRGYKVMKILAYSKETLVAIRVMPPQGMLKVN